MRESSNEIGTIVVGRYAIEALLGRGGMGNVYQARHLQLGKAFALKVITRTLSLDARSRARFLEEARLASMVSHPNIVSVVDFGEDPRLGVFMVMELVAGAPLIEQLGRPQPERFTCEIAHQIADALGHIHDRDIVHGDIKPENVMIVQDTSSGRRRRVARLLDFGLAYRIGTPVVLGGSPHYLAPERLNGQGPSVASDLYALGTLMYVLLSGQLPYTGTTAEIFDKIETVEPIPIDSVRETPIETALATLVMRAMAKDPTARHGSMAAFVYELRAVMQMIGMVRRQKSTRPHASDTRAGRIIAAYDDSLVAQAMLTPTGTITLANRAFAGMLDRDGDVVGVGIDATPFGTAMPDVLARVAHAIRDQRPSVDHMTLGDRDVALWIYPIAGGAQLVAHEIGKPPSSA